MVKVPNRQLNVDSDFEFNSNIANAILALTLINANQDTTTFELDVDGYPRYSQVIPTGTLVNRFLPMGRVFDVTDGKPLYPQHFDMYVTATVTQVFDKQKGNWITLTSGSGGGGAPGTGDMTKAEFVTKALTGVVDEAAIFRDRTTVGDIVESPSGFYVYGKTSNGVDPNEYGFLDIDDPDTGILSLSEFLTNYDSNNDGTVNSADTATEVTGSPSQRQYYGTPDIGAVKGYYDLPNYAGANQLTYDPTGGEANLYIDTNQTTRTHNFRGLIQGNNLQFGDDGLGNLVLSATSGGGANLQFLGPWDANTNTPSLSDGSGGVNEYYIVSVAGTTTIDGESSWAVGDWIVSNGSQWLKIDNSNSVTSVNGNTGAVVLPLGETNHGIQLDGGVETQVFTGLSGTDLQFRSLKEGTGIAFDLTDPNVIEISSTVTPISYSSINLGPGDSGLTATESTATVYYNTSGTTFEHRTLEAGSGLSFDLTVAGILKINASGTGTGIINSGTNVGGQVELYKGVNLDKLEIRTLEGLDNVSVIQNGDVVEIHGPTTVANRVQYGDGAGGFTGEDAFVYDAGTNRLGVEKLGAVTPTAADTAGTDTVISAGASTGTGVGGKTIFDITRAGAAGATENTRVEVMNVDTNGTVNHVNPIAVSTNFIKGDTYEDALGGTFTLWIGDGSTTPQGNLTGTNGDICFNADVGKAYKNISTPSGTDWEELGAGGGAGTLPETKTVRTVIDTNDAVAPLTDQVIQCQPSNVDMDIILPDATLYPDACWTISRDIGDITYELTVSAIAGQTINGSTFYPLSDPWESRTFLSRGAAGWRII